MPAATRYGAICLALAACGPAVKDDAAEGAAPASGLSGGDPAVSGGTDPKRDPPPEQSEISTGPLPGPPQTTGGAEQPVPEPQSMAYWITQGTVVKLVVASWTADICDDPEFEDPSCGTTDQWWIGIDLELPIEPGTYDLEASTGWAGVRAPGDREGCDGHGAPELGRGQLRIDSVGDEITGSLVDAEVAFDTAPMTVSFTAPRCP